ncbi:GNAT family N-acetyltransferase [Cohnella laeviribosi]|uniref:GNAT family N-acetyltransferase n=1 Tax=Cohnella laeviribosi TaxID=380174 RepID=UPI00038164C3|nr:GNAT family N-acetyltransferase [Cohnella laeviribosi]
MNLAHKAPETKEYLDLRTAAGLPSIDGSAAETALGNSIFSVSVQDEASKLVGMGRIVGDGGCCFQIVDLMVDPQHQDNGIDEIIMRELLGYLDQNAPKDADVIVMADVANVHFYQKHGFKLVYPDRYGMSRKG